MNWLANLFTFTEATWLFVIGSATVVLLLTLVLSYVHLRRLDEPSKADPQLALKVLLQFCFSVCLLVFLAGLTAVVRGAMEEYLWGRGTGESTYEVGGYLGLAGAVLATMYYCSLHFGTNHRLFPAAGRVYTFWRFAFHNFVLIAAVSLLAVTLSEPVPNRRSPYHDYLARQWTFLAALVVWGPSWLIHLWLVWKHSASGASTRSISWDVQASAEKKG